MKLGRVVFWLCEQTDRHVLFTILRILSRERSDNCRCCMQVMDCHETRVECATRAMPHPEYWSRDDVSWWLKCCAQNYALSSDLPERFLMNGAYTSQSTTRSHPEMVGDMSCVTLNSDLSKIPFVHS